MMKTFTKLFFFCFCMLLFSKSYAQTIYYVNGDTPTSGNGSSWSTAFKDLQEALVAASNAAGTGHEIRVAKGTYYPSVIPSNLYSSTTISEANRVKTGDRNKTFMLPHGIKLIGGYNGNTGIRDVEGNVTILSGDVMETLSDDTDNAYHVVTIVGHPTGDTNVVTVDGFTITKGRGEGGNNYVLRINSTNYNYYANYGSGIFVRSAAVDLKNLKIIDNKIEGTSVSYAAGIFYTASDDYTPSSFENILFDRNITNSINSYVGGFYVAGRTNKLDRLKFINNSSGLFAGGMHVNLASSTHTLTNCLFYGNVSRGNSNSGGGFYVQSASTIINVINSTFVKNEAFGSGGAAIVTGSNSRIDFVNSIFLGNVSTKTGTEDLSDFNGDTETGSFTLRNCITQGVTEDSQLQAGTTLIPGVNVATNTTLAAVFKNYDDPNSPDFLRLFHTPDNPAIDAGDNSAVPASATTDLAGNVRKFNSNLNGSTAGTPKVDLGAYENILLPLPVNLVTFSAKAQSNGVSLTWATASEKDNSHFVLERSQDGKTYQFLTNVNAKGKAANYQFTDTSPAAGVNYYRLSQVDKDGTKTIFDHLVVNFSVKKGEVLIYPNPTVDGKAFVNFGAAKFHTLQVLSLAGQNLQNLGIKVSETSKEINITNYPSGTYLIRLVGATEILVKKIVK